ncbi:DUF6163 family protein [Bartonella sp. HY329]|uniref:DUF6163 family protein n=1 Tax=unclassified Bartonella TaxID=2645622 RepID=UPI0021C56DC6|nr:MULTISPECIES: DUF6163 family protein [unclassified Bartonella]UXM93955.1 DUF6163 family protein [Bartonella sp. HY329]UXN08276.1 DUF6163 family protein [Bartonella sp. HY328]
MIDQYIGKLKASWNERGFAIFLGVLALFCLTLGTGYWVRLIGVYNEPLWRYDLMPWNWRILCCSLAILYPIAACGLWMGSKWGIILWLIGGFVEAVCYTLYASYFELHLVVPFIHTIFVIAYATLTFLKIKESRKPQEIVVEY